MLGHFRRPGYEEFVGAVVQSSSGRGALCRLIVSGVTTIDGKRKGATGAPLNPLNVQVNKTKNCLGFCFDFPVTLTEEPGLG